MRPRLKGQKTSPPPPDPPKPLQDTPAPIVQTRPRPIRRGGITWERGRPARTKSGTASAISPTLDQRSQNDAADTPLIVTHGARRLPPSGSTAGSALSPTPPQGGSDVEAWHNPPCPIPWQGVNHVPGLLCKGCFRFVPPDHSPLEGESQKPSRQAKADAVGGGSSRSFLPLRGSLFPFALFVDPLRGYLFLAFVDNPSIGFR